MSTSINQMLIKSLEIKEKKIQELEKKILDLKVDITICLKHNESYNLEIRKIKLYNYFFKFIGSIYVLSNVYKYFFY